MDKTILKDGKYRIKLKNDKYAIENHLHQIEYIPNKYYELIVRDGIYIIQDERSNDFQKYTYFGTLEWFDIEKIK